MQIAVDAMGGDQAPDIIIRGAVMATEVVGENVEILLVGDEAQVWERLSGYSYRDGSISVVHAPEVIGMNEPPAYALRKKKGSSIAVATRLQREGRVDALVSAGNTGAVMAASILELGRLEGVRRPAIASVFPSARGRCVVLDVGANAECKPIHLLQFGIMGSIYTQCVFGLDNPTVGLLNIGEESSKGNELTLEAHRLLAESTLNFIGNVEGRDIFKGTADVVVCDGFVGNIILKFAESIIDMLMTALKEKVLTDFRGKFGAFLLRPAFEEFRKELDYQEYGGAPLLGIDGVCIICHGGSSAKAIMNAIKVAERMVCSQVNKHIKSQLRRQWLKTENLVGR